jgi:hypothetical protein
MVEEPCYFSETILKRIAHANNAMEQLHHTKESIFSFSSYVTGLNACCTTLAQADDAVNERNKVTKMLKGCHHCQPIAHRGDAEHTIEPDHQGQFRSRF